MARIELSDEELTIVQQVAEQNNITELESAQLIFLEGVKTILSDVSPTTMAIERIKRAS